MVAFGGDSDLDSDLSAVFVLRSSEVSDPLGKNLPLEHMAPTQGLPFYGVSDPDSFFDFFHGGEIKD